MPELTRGKWEDLGGRGMVEVRSIDEFIEQHTAPLLYQKTRPSGGEHQIFNKEQDFWKASALLPFSTVCLDKFRLSNWFPRAPGVYWSAHGVRARRATWGDATRNEPGLGEFYSPQSKMALIEKGGIGTIRLRPRCIDGINCWFATAVSDTQCAGGVPLIIPDSLTREVSVTWEDTVTIYGQVRFLEDVGLQETAASVHHASPIVIFVEEIEGVPKRQQSVSSTVITPVVLLSQNDSERSQFWRDGYAYTYVQCDARLDAKLDEAGIWIERYAEVHEGRIITNYDELSPILSNAPLSYQRLVDKTYERTIIEHFHHNGPIIASRIDHLEHTMAVNVTLGNGAVVHGNLVVANSIKDSFNRVEESPTDATLKDALKSLSTELGILIENLDSESSEKAADALETLTKEAAREKPRREWLELSLNTIKGVAETVRDVGKPVLETITVLAPLLSGISPK